MAEVDETKGEEALETARTSGVDRSVDVPATDDAEAAVVESLGADKYVFASFFAGGAAVAFIVGKTLQAMWSALAAQPWAVRKLSFLLRYAEDERSTYTMAAGIVVGLLAAIWALRKESIRRW